MIKQFAINYLPFLGKYKRFIKALAQTKQNKKSYSQHQEDAFLVSYIKENNIEINKYKYVDVGANHPTDISNTYLLYKIGMTGFIIEPNKELINLFKIFRKKDILFNIGVSNSTSMLRFYVSKTPVISSFVNNWRDSDTSNSYFVPVMSLDDALKESLRDPIFFLSIDVEGLNTQVLQGALLTAAKSLLVCIEWDDEAEKLNYQKILGSNFIVLKDFGCNTIFKNNNFNL
ncbi:MAG: FkbM family methyltransferase [Chitinophagaceae bacterium]